DNNLVRRMELVYRRAVNDNRPSDAPLETPTLVDVFVERTLWTIHTPDHSGELIPRTGSPISNHRLQLFRFEHTANLLESADNWLNESAVENIEHWYVPW